MIPTSDSDTITSPQEHPNGRFQEHSGHGKLNTTAPLGVAPCPKGCCFPYKTGQTTPAHHHHGRPQTAAFAAVRHECDGHQPDGTPDPSLSWPRSRQSLSLRGNLRGCPGDRMIQHLLAVRVEPGVGVRHENLRVGMGLRQATAQPEVLLTSTTTDVTNVMAKYDGTLDCDKPRWRIPRGTRTCRCTSTTAASRRSP